MTVFCPSTIAVNSCTPEIFEPNVPVVYPFSSEIRAGWPIRIGHDHGWLKAAVTIQAVYHFASQYISPHTNLLMLRASRPTAWNI
jgi:hypothetical protein